MAGLAHTSQLPKSSQISNNQPQWALNPHTLYLLLRGHRPSTNSNQPRFTSWLLLGISKSSTSSSHLTLFCSSGRVAPSKTQVGADPGLYHLGNPRACAPSGQLRTTSEHHCPAPAQLILQRGWRLVVSGHNQYLQLTGLGKPLPFICQQQPRLNYKRWVYSAHIKGILRVPSLGDRGGCAPEPYRTYLLY